MSFRVLVASPLALLLALALAGCDAIGGGSDATLSGQVVNAATNRPISGATVQILSMRVEERSDSTGAYSASVGVDSLMQVRVVAFKTGYAADTVTVNVEPGQTVTVPALLLREGAAGDGTSGPAASITLAPRSSQSVGVSGTGSNETASLTFVARDGDGRPVDAAHAVNISVSIIQGPGGGEFLSPAAPATVRTNANGEATVTLTSGTAAGVVQVETRATVEGRVIRSQPISLVIYGGFPDEAHFSVLAAKRNFPGLAVQGITNAMEAIVGDRYGNPVQPGTQVYFTTTGGVIGGASATNAEGRASVMLTAANPLPRLTGFGTVTARTAGPDGVPVQTSSHVLFSGTPRVTLETAGHWPSGRTSTGSRTSSATRSRRARRSRSRSRARTSRRAARCRSSLGDVMTPGPGRTQFQFTVRPMPGAETPPVVRQIKIDDQWPERVGVGLPAGRAAPRRERHGPPAARAELTARAASRSRPARHAAGRAAACSVRRVGRARQASACGCASVSASGRGRERPACASAAISAVTSAGASAARASQARAARGGRSRTARHGPQSARRRRRPAPRRRRRARPPAPTRASTTVPPPSTTAVSPSWTSPSSTSTYCASSRSERLRWTVSSRRSACRPSRSAKSAASESRPRRFPDARAAERAADGDGAVAARAVHEAVAVAVALEKALARERVQVLRDRVRRSVLEVVHDLAVRRPDAVLANVRLEEFEEGVLFAR